MATLAPVYKLADIPSEMSVEQQIEFWETHSITPELWEEMERPDDT